MSFFKKKLTEQEAASHFVLYIIKEAQDAWPTIHKNLKESFKDKFVVEEEKMAAFDLALAAIAQNLQAVTNLFPKDQAERIEKWVLKCIDTEDWGEYAVDEVKKYGEKFQKDIKNINAGGDPLSAIPARLLQRWLGKNIRNFDVEMNGKKTGIINPVLLVMVSSMLVAFLGSWRKLKDDFNLIEGDIPFDENPKSIKDYMPEPVEKKLDAAMVVNENEYLGEEQGLPKLFNTIDVYLVNDTDMSFPSVKILTGAFASDDENLLETGKMLSPPISLAPHTSILVGKSDTGELDFVVWYDVDMVDENGNKHQFRFSLLKYRAKHKQVYVPLLGCNAYKLDLTKRQGVSVEEWVATHDMKSRYLDFGKNASYPDFK